jgi:glutamate synthase domain-containing protein 2/glutamate synthase domain-containing protein 1/glutamate synthase domain-containing protein 3
MRGPGSASDTWRRRAPAPWIAMTSTPPLYDRTLDHAACGLGFIARVDGRASHEVVDDALTILHNLAHRGATGADEQTGDGAGILMQVPHDFYHWCCRRLPFELPGPRGYAVGTVFFSQDGDARTRLETACERIAAEEGQPIIGWRDVPVAPDAIGRLARSTMPAIRQVFVARTVEDDLAYARILYRIRRRLHWEAEQVGPGSGYVVSLSANTIVYKGLLQGPQLRDFYPDLRHPLVTSALALVHSRFSTNTLGSWPLAHPYRYVAHNGEINAIRGNLNWMRARDRDLQRMLFPPGHEALGPVVQPGGSDSSAFDNVLEALLLSGRSLPHSIMTMVPEAWENDAEMDAQRRAFYEHESAFMAPWDGPACIAFSDGVSVGATLDRNGLRPARYSITRDGRVVLASEEGALPVAEEEIVTRWRLGPGRAILVDTARGRLLHDAELKGTVVRAAPYVVMARRATVRLDDLPRPLVETAIEPASRRERQMAFGYTLEDLKLILPPMVTTGKEPDGSMGTDTPIAVLSDRPQVLFSYFQQLFSQVTNPPIDPLRESLVMSLRVSLGSSPGLERDADMRRLVLDTPILTDDELVQIREIDDPSLRSHTLSLLFPADGGAAALEAALEELRSDACIAAAGGATILILSDRGVDAEHAAIPSLLATSSVHHALIEARLRTRTSLVIETGEAREVHHMALLIGFGASAINPWLAIETIAALGEWGFLEGVHGTASVERYRMALGGGLRKIISKMGISTLGSYCGAQIFEAIGLGSAVVNRHFTGVASRIGGLGLPEITADVLIRHATAFAPVELGHGGLDVGGEYQLREGGEFHAWNPSTIVALQRAVRTGNFATFEEFTGHADGASAARTIRGLLDMRRSPIPLDEVEGEAEIVKRFVTGAMSHGSLSREAHETLAIAMNRMGGKSNTGEGGENPERFKDERRSAIKQVASGRFGVTTDYLVHADVHQIKMAQGSKPGEGGQLPGHKVTGEIAALRYSTPGVGLISPPPHHDIYSIEDLAQLIHDLKNVNPRAQISVKLVSEVGVGTVAAGVAKARADHITISGFDGGTGASPLSSIKHAGLPWELGLAEAQQVLVANGLRGRVRLQVDGGLKTGRDVVIAALLGADEFGFSTAPLVASGCIMMRVCHLNTCPVGIATQDPVLRERFAGTPEHVLNYFFFVARQVRSLMADLGVRRIDEMIGRSDLLTENLDAGGEKARTLDLSALIWTAPRGEVRRHAEFQKHQIDNVLDHRLIAAAGAALEHGAPVLLGSREEPMTVRNTDRALGAMLSGEIVRRHGAGGLPEGTIQIFLRGHAGQSFGAWAASGLTLHLEGPTNDYAGKGLSGGRLIVHPSRAATYVPERSVITGNVALYGATSGEAFFRGVAGERFAVRNSGASAVVEGVGDHGCEYMTGGVIVVLGRPGRNFAAGMSGGRAFVFDPNETFATQCNRDMVDLEPVVHGEDIAVLQSLIEAHLLWTGSSVAARIHAGWGDALSRFVLVMPHDLKRVLAERAATASEAEEPITLRAAV